jgi:hypothetical protein
MAHSLRFDRTATNLAGGDYRKTEESALTAAPSRALVRGWCNGEPQDSVASEVSMKLMGRMNGQECVTRRDRVGACRGDTSTGGGTGAIGQRVARCRDDGGVRRADISSALCDPDPDIGRTNSRLADRRAAIVRGGQPLTIMPVSTPISAMTSSAGFTTTTSWNGVSPGRRPTLAHRRLASTAGRGPQRRRRRCRSPNGPMAAPRRSG